MCPDPAVGYARFSDNKQIGNNSIEIQKDSIIRAAERNNYEIVAWFSDEGVSAYHRKVLQRPGMQALVEYVLGQRCEAVFFYDESRITRQVTDFVEDVWGIISERCPNVKFFSASVAGDEEWDPNDWETELRLVMASHESKIKVGRAKDSQRMMLHQARPKRPGSKALYGFDMFDGILHPNNDAAIVYFIFFLASWGYGDEKVAKCLDDAGVPSPSGGGWNASTIDLIINHKAHLGHLSWDVRKGRSNSARKPDYQISLFENVHEAIVPAHLWEMVHGLRRLKKTTGLKFATSNFLDGIVSCSSCDSILKAKDQSPSGAKGKYVKYQCPTCGKKVSASELHKVVLQRVARDLNSNNAAVTFEKKAKSLMNQWQRKLAKERQSLLASKERATFGLDSGELSDELETSFRIAVRELDDGLRRNQDLIDRVAAIQGDPENAVLMRRFGEIILDSLSNIERRTFLLAVVDSVKVSFGSSVRVNLEYRLSPYVSLENDIGHFAETGGE